MELRQLKYFCKVAELANFSEAAKQLNISQSTLSQQIRTLENELNATLLIRDTHRVRLTDVGEAFLPSARRTLTEAADSINRIRDIQHLHAGQINIGCTFTFSPLLCETVLEYMKKFPGVKLNIVCKPMEELMELLDKEKIDVALNFKPSQSFPNIESHILFSSHLAVVMSEDHPLAQAKVLRPADIERFPLVLPAKGLQARNAFDLLVANLDRQFDVKLEINDVSLLLSIVKGSKFISLLSSAVNRENGIKAIPFDAPGNEMEGAFSLRKGAYMKGSVREFLKLLSDSRSYSLALMDLGEF